MMWTEHATRWDHKLNFQHDVVIPKSPNAAAEITATVLVAVPGLLQEIATSQQSLNDTKILFYITPPIIQCFSVNGWLN